MGGVPISIQLLGGFAVTVGDRTVPEAAWRQRKAAELVKVLALAPRHRTGREQVAEALWPDGDPVTGTANVRKAAFHARHALDLRDGLVLEDGVVILAPGHPVSTDVAGFRAAADAALQHGDAPACRAAAELYAGELLPDDRYAEWCTADRAQLRGLYRDVLAGGRLWGRLVAEDPTDERAHREIMQAQLDNGERTAAIRQFDVLRTTLREELGISPGPESVAVYQQVLDMEGTQAPTPAERARALLAWGVVHWERTDLAEAERTALEVRALAVDAGLPQELTQASELLGLVAYARGAWKEVFAREYLGTVAATPELAPFLFDANMCMSEFALGEVNGPKTVATFAADLLTESDRLSSDHARALGLLLRGESGLLAGDDPGVRADLTEAEGLHRRSGSLTGQVLSVERLAQLEAHEGDTDEATRRHRRALQIAEQSAIPQHLLPWIYGGMIESASPTEAAELLAEAERATEGLKVCDPCAMALRVGGAAVCADAGEVARGRKYLAQASRVSRMWSDGPWHAAVLEAQAALDHADGVDDARVAGLFHQAAAGYAAAGRPREEARCRRRLALVG